MKMKNFNWRLPIGFVILVFGLLALLQTLNVFQMKGDLWLLAFALIFATTGATFLYALVVERSNWWAAIPGLTLLGLGVMMGLLTFDGIPNMIPPFIFMASISASFWVVYAATRQWWAIIPGGVLASVALTILVSEINGLAAGGLMFLGIAATFAVLALIGVGKDSGSLPWPWFPAGILFLFGTLVLVTGGTVSGLIGALLLIGAGAFLVLRPYLKK
jgi:hypothetical protein